MNENITVWYNGGGLRVYKCVATLLGIKHGQEIQTEAQYLEILGANLSHGLALCKAFTNIQN